MQAQLTEATQSLAYLRTAIRDFCDDDIQFEAFMRPILDDPDSFAKSSTCKPIFRKFAILHLTCIDLQARLDDELEAARDACITPLQVKTDLKRRIAGLETKLSAQDKLIKSLQEDVSTMKTIMHNLVRATPKALEYAAEGDVTHHLVCPENHTTTFIIALYTGNLDNMRAILKHGTINFMTGVHSGSDLTWFPVANKAMKAIKVIRYTLMQHAAALGSLDAVNLLFEFKYDMGHEGKRWPSVTDEHSPPPLLHVPSGPTGDLVAGVLLAHGVSDVKRF